MTKEKHQADVSDIVIDILSRRDDIDQYDINSEEFSVKFRNGITGKYSFVNARSHTDYSGCSSVADLGFDEIMSELIKSVDIFEIQEKLKTPTV